MTHIPPGIENIEKSERRKMSRLTYVAKKIQYIAQRALLKESGQFIHCLSLKSQPSCPEKVGFYLDNPTFIHLGDQLFFEPAVRLLAGTFKTCIRPTPAMTEYFTNCGAHVVKDDEIFNCDVIVTRDELLTDVIPKAKGKADIVSINTYSDNMQHRICKAITHGLAHVFQIPIPDHFRFTPWIPLVPVRKAVADKVLLAPYVDSGWFRVRRFDVEQLSHQAKIFAKKSGLSLCLVGGACDAACEIPGCIGSEFEDWRGRFNPYQFTHMLASGHVARVFTFDTFVFHAAVASGVPATIKIRRRSPKKRQFITDHYLPADLCAGQQIDFI